MPSVLDRISETSRALRLAFGGKRGSDEARYSVDQWITDYLKPSTFNYNGTQYVYGSGPYSHMAFADAVAEISSTLPAYAAALRSAPPAFAAEMVRALILSQARFTFRGRQSSSKPRRTFGTRALSPLENPAPGVTTGKMLARMEWHAGVAGNSFVYRKAGKRPGDPPRLKVLRPDWTALLWGSDTEPEDAPFAIDAELLGYVYWNGGYGRNKPWSILPEDMCHWAPIPDPENAGLGMSWVTPALREMQGDSAATEHKLMFFHNGATPAMVVKNLTGPAGLPLNKDQFNDLVDMLEARHTGYRNAYKTLYLTGAADATVIGSDLKQIDFKATQGGGETRLSFLSRVPAAILGISEGLAGSSLNAGNFGMARRIFADTWVYPTLQDLAGSFAPIIDVPADAELWPDTSDMPILREDSKDQAEITQIQATSLASLIQAGYTPESAQIAIQTGDLSQLKHTGLFSVQLQPPGNGQLPGGPGAPTLPTTPDGGTPGGGAVPTEAAPTEADWNDAIAAATAATAGRSTTGTRDVDPAPAPLPGQLFRDAIRSIAAASSAARDDEDDDDPVGDLDIETEALLVALEEYAAEASGQGEERALTGAAFNAKHKRGPDGKFIKMIDLIKDALDKHQKSGGKGDPFKGFDREQLRKVAKLRGIPLKRGEDRDSIAAKLHIDLTKSAPGKVSAAPKAPATPTPAAPQKAPVAPVTSFGPALTSLNTQGPALNHAAIQHATDVVNRRQRAHSTQKAQLDAYGSLTKADFDSMDPAVRTWLLSDLSFISMKSTGPNGNKARSLQHRFSPAGTPLGTAPTPPILPPAGAKAAKKASTDLAGTPGLLKRASDSGVSGDGWYTPPGATTRVWGKYGAAGLLLRHRGDDGVDRYLMVQRGPAISDPGKWQFPGGAIDSKETPYEGATREVLEELGFKDADLAPGRVHGTHEVVVGSGAGAWRYTSIAATVPTQIKPDLSTHHARAETSDARWMTADEIRQLDKDGKLLGPLAGGQLEQNVLSLFPKTPGKRGGKAGPPPLPTHKPSRGRDLIGDKAAIDKLRQDVKHARQAYAGKVADDRLAAIGAMQGYDDVPTVATKAEMDRLLATGDYIEAWRGVRGNWGGKTAAQMQEEFRSGPAWYGKGFFGNGYYIATQRSVAEQYSDGTKGSVVRILIPKSAIVKDHGAVMREAHAIASPRSKAKGHSFEDGTLYDEGRYAAAKGLDGIRIEAHSVGKGSARHVAKPGQPAYNWLNRSVLIIQKD